MTKEVIERKGIGHPDTICDSLAECLANKLKEAYKEQYGKLQHYNVDKVLASCGEVNYKKKKMTKPVKIVFSGNATKLKGIKKILKATVEQVMFLEIDRGLKYKIFNHISYCSPDLTSNYEKKKSNDTSFSVGSPLTKNEKLVLAMGEYIEIFTQELSEVGSDYKIMFVNGQITVALALIAKERKHYEYIKSEIKYRLEDYFSREIKLNTADTKETCFNTVTGTSLEQGDAGMVGRGNRYNGLITPMRPMTMEAYYGKNDVTHIGRIYQKKAFDLAQKENKKILMVANIGENIDKPTIIRWS